MKVDVYHGASMTFPLQRYLPGDMVSSGLLRYMGMVVTGTSPERNGLPEAIWILWTVPQLELSQHMNWDLAHCWDSGRDR